MVSSLVGCPDVLVRPVVPCLVFVRPVIRRLMFTFVVFPLEVFVVFLLEVIIVIIDLPETDSSSMSVFMSMS
jgi:hypothetical protein